MSGNDIFCLYEQLEGSVPHFFEFSINHLLKKNFCHGVCHSALTVHSRRIDLIALGLDRRDGLSR